MWEVSVPISVPISKNKNFSLNLNQYRNAHFRVLTKAKKEFARLVAPKVRGIPILKKVRISYILYPSWDPDVANVCCIVDKFFSDVLVSEGKIEDDNPRHLPMVAYGFGETDKQNPRVEIIIEAIK